jgi:predicted SprT family Zn-dependent metalloprotease
MNSEAKIKRFLKVKVAQWYYLIVERDSGVPGEPYTVTFYKSFHGMGANAGCIALCGFARHDIEFNMKKIMWNSENLLGLEALVIHEICHIIAPRTNGAHGPAFKKLYQHYAGNMASAIGTLIKLKKRGKIVYYEEGD